MAFIADGGLQPINAPGGRIGRNDVRSKTLKLAGEAAAQGTPLRIGGGLAPERPKLDTDSGRRARRRLYRGLGRYRRRR